MRRALILAIALALSACAAPVVTTPSPIKATAHGNVTGVATASLWGTWEAELAAPYTRLTVLVRRATRQLEKGQIDVVTALAIQHATDEAQRLLDASRRGPATNPTATQRLQLVEAIRWLDQAESKLEQ